MPERADSRWLIVTTSKFTLLVILSLLPFSVAAQLLQDQNAEILANEDKLHKIKTMLENKDFLTKDGIERIHLLAEDIGNFQKDEFYEKYQTSGWWGLLNIYGIGSFIQGDPMTSVYTIIGEIGGGLLALAGMNVTSSHNGRNVAFSPTPLFFVGYSIAAGSMIYGQVRPWYVASERNQLLRQALY